MSLTAKDAFGMAWEKYRVWKEWLEARAEHVRTIDYGALAGDRNWRPDRRWLVLWCADFERMGREVISSNGIEGAPLNKTGRRKGEPDRRRLRKACHEGRLRLWECYFVGGLEYRQAIRAVNVPSGTFDYWVSILKDQIGAEILRAGLLARKAT